MFSQKPQERRQEDIDEDRVMEDFIQGLDANELPEDNEDSEDNEDFGSKTEILVYDMNDIENLSVKSHDLQPVVYRSMYESVTTVFHDHTKLGFSELNTVHFYDFWPLNWNLNMLTYFVKTLKNWKVGVCDRICILDLKIYPLDEYCVNYIRIEKD